MEAEELVPISALQHHVYCPRQCALIHVEGTFDENLYTLRGQRVHRRVDDPDHEFIVGVRVERALPLFSHRLGLTGRADVVEFLADETPYPVEYKAGARKPKDADDVQLCAQALCLEEMLDRDVPEGSIYYDRTRRRRIVAFDAALREKTAATARAVHALVTEAQLPAPVADARCPNCSLIDACMPYVVREHGKPGRPSTLFDVEGVR